MSIRNIQKTVLVLLGVFLLSDTMQQCTKEAINAPKVSRALVREPDSTVFSPFYDSTLIATADVPADINDVIGSNGVRNIILSNCASAACHGGAIAPKLTTYAEIKGLVSPGNPEASELFQLITTNDLNDAMPPINYGVDLSITEKVKIYNWIKAGAKEFPDLTDFRPAAISLLTNGCASANCHNQATVGGEWARRDLITLGAPTDTVSYSYINPGTGLTTIYAQLKEPLLSTVWNAYKDSVKRFYTDTLANAGYRPYKTFGTPVLAAGRRGPLNSYDDIIMDIMYPKNLRSNSSVQFTDPNTGNRFYVKGNYLNSNDCFVRRMDSTIVYINPVTGLPQSKSGNMAWDDGGFTPSEVALFKAWYFADPNVPDVWKYGPSNIGIYKRRSGTLIRQ